jgi:WD40 repeat protein
MFRLCFVAFAALSFLDAPARGHAPAAAGIRPRPAERRALVDLHGDPLPPGATVRLGTVRFRQPGRERTIAFAPDGRSIVSTTQYDSLCIWNADDGRLLRRLENEPDHVAAYSPDGKLLAGVGALRPGKEVLLSVIRFWDAVTAREVRTIRQDQAAATSAVFAPDGKALLAAHLDGAVRAWDVASGKELRRITLASRSVDALALSTAGNVLAVMANSKRGQTVHLWKWQSDAPPRPLLTLDRNTLSLAFSPDGTTLATASYSPARVLLWDASTLRLQREVPLADSASYPRAIAFSPDGKLFAATDERRGVTLWDARTWARLPSLPVPGDRALALAFAPDGRRLAAGTESGVRVWDLATGKAIAEHAEAHRNSVTQVVFSPEPGVVVTAAHDNTVRCWDAATGRQRRVFQVGPWSSFALSPDAKRLVTASLDDTVRVWDAAGGRQLFKLYGHGTTGSRLRVHFLPGGDRFASFGYDWYLRVWRTASGKALREHPVRADGIGPIGDDEDLDERARATIEEKLILAGRPAFTPDGRRMVLPVGVQMHVFDVETGKEIRTLVHSDGGPVSGLTVSPDGRWLLSSRWGSPPVLVLHSLERGNTVRRILLTEDGAGPVAFSPSGKFFAAGAGRPSPRIRVYEIATGELARTFANVPGAVGGLAFSDDGRLLASALDDTTVMIWDLTRPPVNR